MKDECVIFGISFVYNISTLQNFDLPISELPETITTIEEENKAFEEMHP